MDTYEPIVIHELTYTVGGTTEHLASHGVTRARLEWLLERHGVAAFFTTATTIHRWFHELEWWCGPIPRP